MRRILRAKLLASVLVVSVVPFFAVAVPANAQYRSDAGFDSFHSQLAQYGDWVYSDRWGLVWQPADVPDYFRPYYSGGRWVYTRAYGWTWSSDYEWGDIAFHYGRWVDDPYDGWMWIPGYTWSPGWVVWRSNAHSIGWMAMPPDDRFLRGQGDSFISISFGGVSVNWNNTSDNYGYSRWYGRDYDHRRFAQNWTFVDTGHMTDRDYRRVAYAPERAITSFSQTKNITDYATVNNYMVNRSVDVRTVERASGRPVVPVAAAVAFKHPGSVMTVDAGKKARAREFDRAPHGTGIANSAPQPPPAVINKLSDHVAPRHAGGKADVNFKDAGGPSHLFTKKTITAPAAATQFHGKLPAGQAVTTPATVKPVPGAMTVPGGGDSAAMPGGKMRDKRTGGLSAVPGPTAPVGTPLVVKPLEHKAAPPALVPLPEPVVKPIERKKMQQIREPSGKPFERTAPPPVSGPVMEPVVHPMDRRMMQPVTEPMAHPMERKTVRPMAEPVVKPVREPVAKPEELRVVPPPPVIDTPPPVVNNPPPVVESGKPPTKTPDEPNKNRRNKKDENGKPN